MVQKHRISTNIGKDQVVKVELKQDFDLLMRDVRNAQFTLRGFSIHPPLEGDQKSHIENIAKKTIIIDSFICFFTNNNIYHNSIDYIK